MQLQFPQEPNGDDTKNALPIKPLQAPRLSLFAAIGLILTAGIVAMFLIKVEAVVKAEGAVETGVRVLSIETQDGGTMEDIFVTQGQKVVAGQELAIISNATIFSKFMEIENELTTQRAKAFRLMAEQTGAKTLEWPENFAKTPETIKAEQLELFETRRSRWESEMGALRQEADTLRKDLAGAEGELVATQEEQTAIRNIMDFKKEGYDNGWVNRADVLQAESQYAQTSRDLIRTRAKIPSLQSQIAATTQRMSETALKQRQSILDELEDVNLRIQTLQATLEGAEDKDARRILRANEPAIVNAIHVTGPGDVVQPGEGIMDLVPVDKGQIIRARILPSQRRGIYPGLPAKISLTALQDLRMPPIDGKVIFVAADTIKDPKDGKTYYEIHVETEKSVLLLPNGQETYVEPGMQAIISVIVGKHSIADFLLRPLEWTIENSFRER